MKLRTQLFAATVLAAATASTYAASSVSLEVKGTLGTPACTIALDDSGVVTFDDIARTILSSTDPTGIGSKKINANVSCSGITLIALKVEDNRAASRPTAAMKFKFQPGGNGPDETNLQTTHYFSFSTDETTPVGLASFAIRVEKIKVDTVEIAGVRMGSDYAAMNGATYANFTHVKPSELVAPYAAGINVPSSGRDFVFPLEIAASVMSTYHIPSAAEIVLKGDATVSVVYL
ncbi:DUF1120 domain-containing protein [Herbaspirillum sp. RTI4]|uniref:DUF1120 domain-containing protein n=1 Tax=Herbaspirillum sp. RTI4 TaxID=3048640 RepID=UPI002AB4A88F|nr:DUF1120 domain-containing protein [Herbaspirillum sp. RTI4]MDY7577725.1 DUF1120 domain-containing protein [Herbaspirillum sp. RTI4]MEA9980847.1 DUF1120 domain-containing protein [Herbaspirillum sp. RTI4]